jgi:hypothetical protein
VPSFTFGPPPPPSPGDADAGLTCIQVAFNGWQFDGLTPDADGVIYDWKDLPGWWDSPASRVSTTERQPFGSIVTAARENERQLVLNGVAHMPRVAAVIPNPYKAIRRLKAACHALSVPGVLTVYETDLTLQAYARLAQPIRTRRIMTNLGCAAVEFDIPLTCADPRRYAAPVTTNTALALTSSATTVTATIANGGDEPTGPVFTIDGPATNPRVQNNTLSTTPSVRYVGVLGGADTLVIDMNKQTAVLNGTTDETANLDNNAGGPPFWWLLQPGNNSCHYTRTAGTGSSTAQADYHDAYS